LTNKGPLLPAFYAYSISGDKLVLIDSFKLRFARWEDYATYLGNYNDNSNDFSKTGTIPFKVGIEVSDDVTKEPLLILVKKENWYASPIHRLVLIVKASDLFVQKGNVQFK
jgi:hypothetical protein